MDCVGCGKHISDLERKDTMWSMKERGYYCPDCVEAQEKPMDRGLDLNATDVEKINVNRERDRLKSDMAEMEPGSIQYEEAKLQLGKIADMVWRVPLFDGRGGQSFASEEAANSYYQKEKAVKGEENKDPSPPEHINKPKGHTVRTSATEILPMFCKDCDEVVAPRETKSLLSCPNCNRMLFNKYTGHTDPASLESEVPDPEQQEYDSLHSDLKEPYSKYAEQYLGQTTHPDYKSPEELEITPEDWNEDTQEVTQERPFTVIPKWVHPSEREKEPRHWMDKARERSVTMDELNKQREVDYKAMMDSVKAKGGNPDDLNRALQEFNNKYEEKQKDLWKNSAKRLGSVAALFRISEPYQQDVIDFVSRTARDEEGRWVVDYAGDVYESDDLLDLAEKIADVWKWKNARLVVQSTMNCKMRAPLGSIERMQVQKLLKASGVNSRFSLKLAAEDPFPFCNNCDGPGNSYPGGYCKKCHEDRIK